MITLDISNPIEVGAVGFRALNDALGADGARVFIHYFVGRVEPERPRITAAQVSDILEQSMVRAMERQEQGLGDFTAEKYSRPERLAAEITAEQKRMSVAMMELRGKYPDRSIGEITADFFKTENVQRGIMV